MPGKRRSRGPNKDFGERKYLSNLAKSLEKEVHIGFLPVDKVLFDVLKDILNSDSSKNYEEIKHSLIEYNSILKKEDKRYKESIFEEFEQEIYPSIKNYAKNIGAQIVILYRKNILHNKSTYNIDSERKLKLEAYYFKQRYK